MCQAQLLCAGKLTEAGFLRISLPRPAYPPSSFLHPGAIAPSCGIPRCLGVPSGRAEVLTAPALVPLRWPKPPLQRVQLPLLRRLGRPGIQLSLCNSQLSLLDLLCHMPASGQMAGGRRKAEEEMWQADGVNIHTTFPREIKLKRSSLLPGRYVKELHMRNAVCDSVQEPMDIYTVI